MKNYHWDAADYAQYSRAQQEWARVLMNKLQLQGDECILDIGCGDGKVTAELAHRVPDGKVVGVDNAVSMLKLAQSKYPSVEYSNLNFIAVDAQALFFKNEFDIVFSNAVMHWIKDHLPVLMGIARSLKEGGRVLMQMGGKGNAAGVISILEDIIQLKSWSLYFRDFDFPYSFYCPDEYKRMTTESGLQFLRVELIEKDMQHEGTLGFAGWIRTTWLPYTDRIPRQKRENFIQEVVEQYVHKHPVDMEGKVHVQMMRLEVEAVKE